MPNNDYLARVRKERTQYINLGIDHGQQWMLDMFLVALHRQGWGYDRIKRIVDEVQKLSDYYSDALHRGMEQDVMQERLDAELADILKGREPLIPFRERHPLVVTTGYDRLPKR